MTTTTLTGTGETPPIEDESRVRHSGKFSSFFRGRSEDPGWIRPSLIGLLLATAALYLWGLGASSYANSFYSAAAQAGSASWKAMFFGSSDAANSITVDKPPAALWIMAASVRVFGLNAWSILVPQALEGVAAVGVLYLAVRRTSGPLAGLIAGAAFAVTPVAALMFRFNNPDALLVLLMTAAAYCLIRSLEHASGKWLAAVGVLTGFGFLTKMMQSLLVVPAFALVYLLAAPTSLRRRLLQLLAAGGAMLAAAGWWITIVELTPARYRPYIGGSQHNSILELTLGYNGLGRLTGNETGSVGGGQGGRWGAAGWSRLFGSEMGGEISWLLPTSLLLLGAGLWFTRRSPRTDQTRAGLLMWGGWLIVTGVIFSYMQGIVHPYYTVALAPAVGALVGIGATMLWNRRQGVTASILLAITVVLTAAWEFILLNRVSGWLPWLRYSILGCGIAIALSMLAVAQLKKRLSTGIAIAALVTSLAGPTAYSIATAATPHTGAIPSVGPAGYSTGMGRGRAGPGGIDGRGGIGGLRAMGGLPGMANGLGGGAGGQGGLPGMANGAPGNATGGMRAGAGGLLNSSTPSSEVVAALKTNSAKYTWVAAAVGANSAAGFQLATELPVMAIGGFNGSDASPTLAEFQGYVAAGKIHYFIAGGGMGGGQAGSSTSSSAISSWIQANFSTVTIGGVSMYDLTPASG
jgi:4-amino-4-deoxy-L-arabinose transferase-like glycosyltransferase